MSKMARYLLDSDVFIQAKNSYYAFSICPGFWESIIGYHDREKIYSIDHISHELLRGDKKEDLVHWVKNDLPKEFFLSTKNTKVVDCYQDIMLWVQKNPQFLDYAKAKFATEADGWLAAYAKINNFIVVTGEQLRPEAKNRFPLPNVCEVFDVRYESVFYMLNDMDVKYIWNK